MIFIDKTTEPVSYTTFLTQKHQVIQNKIQDPRQTGVKIWKWFRSNANGVLDDLKDRLLEDQGYICCYCGEKISDKDVVIEHLDPKSNKALVFPFSNLYASCIGGNGKIITVGRHDNLQTISIRYDIEQAELIKLNPGKTFTHPESVKVYEADPNGEHCDHKKNGDVLVNKPNQPTIFEKIKYEFNSNKTEVEALPVKSGDQVLHNDIKDVLNLNQETLKKRRAIILKRLDKELMDIINLAPSCDVIITEFLDLYSDLKIKVNGKYDPFYFVCMSYINQQGLNYIDVNC